MTDSRLREAARGRRLSAGIGLLAALSLAPGCGESAPQPPPPEPAQEGAVPGVSVRLIEHLLEVPDCWVDDSEHGAANPPTELKTSNDRLSWSREEGLLALRLPWPAHPARECALVREGRRVLGLDAVPTPWIEAPQIGARVAFSPRRFRHEAEMMERADSSELSHAATMASLIALPHGSSLRTTLPPLTPGSVITVVARASGEGEGVVGLRVEDSTSSEDRVLPVTEDWRPHSIPAGGGVEAIDLRLSAVISGEGAASRRLVVKRVEVVNTADVLLIRADGATLDTFERELAEGRLHVEYTPEPPTPTTVLDAAVAWNVEVEEQGFQQLDHWVWIEEGRVEFVMSGDTPARLSVDRERVPLQGRRGSITVAEARLARVSLECDTPDSVGGLTVRVLQSSAAARQRRVRDLLPEPLYLGGSPAASPDHSDQAPPASQVAKSQLHRLEFSRERKVSWILTPGEALRFQLPPTAPLSLRWEHVAWSAGSAFANGALALRVRCLDAEDRPLDERRFDLTAGPEKQATWSAARQELEDPELIQTLEFEVLGEPSVLGEDGRLISHFLALTPPTLVDPGKRPGGIILHCVDTLRADHLSLMGYPRPTSPQLDALAGELVIFEDAYSTCSWTRPSTASLLTGLHPIFHGAYGRNVLATEVTTLAERFHAAGYATGAVVTNPNVSSRNLGFEEGFEDFYAAFGDHGDQFEIASSEFHDWVEGWLDRHSHEPFFLYVHAVDPHSPYTPEEEGWRRFDPDYQGTITGEHQGPGAFERVSAPSPADVAHIEALYDAEIVEVDAALAELVHSLRRMELWDQTTWVLTSDHGEEFQERGGWLHGQRAWQEQIHVPLMIKPAASWNVEPRRSRHRAQITDIAPTLIDFAGLEPEVPASAPSILGQRYSGDSLAPVLRGAVSEDPDRALYLDENPAVQTFLAGPHKLVMKNPDSQTPEAALYDLRADPEERRDLASAQPALVHELAQRVTDQLAVFDGRGLRPAYVRGRVAVMSEEEINTLMALGYLDATASKRDASPQRED